MKAAIGSIIAGLGLCLAGADGPSIGAQICINLSGIGLMLIPALSVMRKT